jgi:hypothetical protein
MARECGEENMRADRLSARDGGECNVRTKIRCEYQEKEAGTEDDGSNLERDHLKISSDCV